MSHKSRRHLTPVAETAARAVEAAAKAKRKARQLSRIARNLTCQVPRREMDKFVERTEEIARRYA